MRSGRRVREGQDFLPFDLLVPTVPAGESRAGDPRPRVKVEPEDERIRCRLRNDAFVSRGWPAGTELLVEPGRRPQRGEVALVREGGRLKIGVFDLQLGRPVLRTDLGSVWLGASARYVGVATLVGAPLAGMPELPLPG